MTNQITEDIVKQFIIKLNSQWNDLDIEYSYDDQEDIWDICHFNYDLQYNNIEFQKSAGKLIRTLFFDQGIFNLSFGYKHLPEFSTTELISIKPSSITIGDSISIEWLGGLQNEPKSLSDAGGRQVRNISGYTAYSRLLKSYDYELGTSDNIGTTTINGGFEVLVA